MLEPVTAPPMITASALSMEYTPKLTSVYPHLTLVFKLVPVLFWSFLSF